MSNEDTPAWKVLLERYRAEAPTDEEVAANGVTFATFKQRYHLATDIKAGQDTLKELWMDADKALTKLTDALLSGKYDEEELPDLTGLVAITFGAFDAASKKLMAQIGQLEESPKEG